MATIKCNGLQEIEANCQLDDLIGKRLGTSKCHFLRRVVGIWCIYQSNYPKRVSSCGNVRMALLGDRQEDMSTQLVGHKPMIDWCCADR